MSHTFTQPGIWWREASHSTWGLIITKSGEQYKAMTKNEILSQGTHATMRSYMEPYELDWGREYDQGRFKYNSGRGYYRGERVVLQGVIPEAGYLTHKKWHLNEVRS